MTSIDDFFERHPIVEGVTFIVPVLGQTLLVRELIQTTAEREQKWYDNIAPSVGLTLAITYCQAMIYTGLAIGYVLGYEALFK